MGVAVGGFQFLSGFVELGSGFVDGFDGRLRFIAVLANVLIGFFDVEAVEEGADGGDQSDDSDDEFPEADKALVENVNDLCGFGELGSGRSFRSGLRREERGAAISAFDGVVADFLFAKWARLYKGPSKGEATIIQIPARFKCRLWIVPRGRSALLGWRNEERFQKGLHSR